MLILPLGLGGKVPKFPYVSFCLAVVSIFLSILFFPDVKAIETSSYSKKLQDSRLKIIEDYCPNFGLPSGQCEIVKGLVHNKGKKAKNKNGEVRTEDFLSAIKYIEWVSKQLNHPTDGEFIASEPYRNFQQVQGDMESWFDGNFPNFLSARHLQARALLLAQFIHAGWFHLIGNFFVFFAFAVFLEQRIDVMSFLAIYFLGGTLGLVAQLEVFADHNMLFLLGASANISAVMGAFYVFFFKRKMRFLGTLVFWNKIFVAPVSLMVPVLYLAADVTGLLGGVSNVAHGAHLIGFLAGALIGYGLLKIDPMEPAYLYSTEYDLHKKMQKEISLPAKVKVADQILAYNSDNVLVMNEVIKAILQEWQRTQCLAEGSGRFLVSQFTSFTAICWKSDQYRKLLGDIFDRLPYVINFKVYLPRLGQLTILRLATAFLNKGRPFIVLRLYDLYMRKWPSSKNINVIAMTSQNLIEKLKADPKGFEELKFFRDSYRLEPKMTMILDKYIEPQGVTYAKLG
jgi:membrane associated rhomboid family serine protease